MSECLHDSTENENLVFTHAYCVVCLVSQLSQVQRENEILEKMIAEALESYANSKLEEAAVLCDENTTPSKEICNSEYHDVRFCSDCDRMTAMAYILGQEIRALKSEGK